MSHLFDATILGTIQALAEFLPISSSGHLLLAHEFLNYDVADSLTFDVSLHIGTLLALLVYFRKDIIGLFGKFLESLTTRPWAPAHRLPWYILIAAIPAGLAGATFEWWFESIRDPWVVVAMLILFGIVFLAVEHRRSQPNGLIESITLRMALWIGLAQVLSLIPGVSRSGVTIVAGMLVGLTRSASARFTFLLSIPVVAGASAKKLFDLQGTPPARDERAAMLLGIIVAAVVGYLVIRFLLRFLAQHRLDIFAYYRFALASLVAIILMTR